MIAGALFYYQAHSVRNRLRARLQRLRQPKYLIGAVAGLLYFYGYVVRGISRSGLSPHAAWMLAPEHRFLAESIAALVLLGLMLLAWVLPHSRAALTFSEAEIAFLFPAPINRRALLHFKLLKSQTAILVSALFMTLLGRGLGGGNYLMRALDWWAILSVFNLHLLGSSFAMTLLMDRGISPWKRRVAVLAALAVAAAAMTIWLRQSLPPPPNLETNTLPRLEHYVTAIFQSTQMLVLLFPFRLVVAPFFAVTWPQFLGAFAILVVIVLLHYAWVVRSDVAFEEASLEASRKLAERVARMRSGQWTNMGKPARAARAPFRLRPAGPPLVALIWKNLISAGRFVTTRAWLFALWIIVAGGTLSQTAGGHHGAGAVIGIIGLMLTAVSLFSGPQMLRNDLRQDLPVADVLKLFPLPGWQIVLGEILAPAAMLAGAQWLCLTVAVVFWPDDFGRHALPFAARALYGLALAIVLPGIDVIAMLIPNAAVLFLPAWFQLGKDAPRGFENTGQQLILMFGQVLVLACSLIPAAAVFAAILFAGVYLHVGPAAAVAAALAGVVVLGLEAALGIKLLGTVFESFDLSGELLNAQGL